MDDGQTKLISKPSYRAELEEEKYVRMNELMSIITAPVLLAALASVADLGLWERAGCGKVWGVWNSTGNGLKFTAKITYLILGYFNYVFTLLFTTNNLYKENFKIQKKSIRHT